MFARVLTDMLLLVPNQCSYGMPRHAASRDHAVKLWCTDDPNGTAVYKPLETRFDHKVTLMTLQY